MSIDSSATTTLLPRTDDDVERLRFSPSGETLLAADGAGVLRAWSTSTRVLLFQATDPGGRVRDLAFSPDGRRIAAIADNGGVWIFSDQGTRLRELTFKNRAGTAPWSGQPGVPWSVAFSPDGLSIAAGSVNGEVIIWNAETGAISHTFIGHGQEQVSMVTFAPNGRSLASACFDGTVKVWRLE
jgi:WD40 repeat protein